jgi:hypothetical protein
MQGACFQSKRLYKKKIVEMVVPNNRISKLYRDITQNEPSKK